MSKAQVQSILMRSDYLLKTFNRFPKAASAYFLVSIKALEMAESIMRGANDKFAADDMDIGLLSQVDRVETAIAPFFDELSAQDLLYVQGVFTELRNKVRFYDVAQKLIVEE